MVRNLQVRGIPDPIHRTLVARARREGMSLSRYVLRILEGQCELPTLDEWLSELDELAPVSVTEPAAEAVGKARTSDDLLLGRDRRR